MKKIYSNQIVNNSYWVDRYADRLVKVKFKPGSKSMLLYKTDTVGGYFSFPAPEHNKNEEFTYTNAGTRITDFISTKVAILVNFGLQMNLGLSPETVKQLGEEGFYTYDIEFVEIFPEDRSIPFDVSVVESPIVYDLQEYLVSPANNNVASTISYSGTSGRVSQYEFQLTLVNTLNGDSRTHYLYPINLDKSGKKNSPIDKNDFSFNQIVLHFDRQIQRDLSNPQFNVIMKIA